MDLPIRMKGNLEEHFQKFIESVQGPEQGSCWGFTGVTKPVSIYYVCNASYLGVDISGTYFKIYPKLNTLRVRL